MAKKSEKENKNKNIHEVEVKIEGKTWTDAIDKVFIKKQKTAKVDGFRKGKVPRHVYEKKFGKESLFFEAADLVIQDAYVKAMDDSKLTPVVRPGVNLKNISEDGVEFVFKIITKPEVTLKKYKGLGVKPTKVKVSKEEIDHELGHLLERYTEKIARILFYSKLLYKIFESTENSISEENEDKKAIYQKYASEFIPNNITFSFNFDNNKVSLDWQFNSLKQAMEVLLGLNEANDRKELKMCKHCGKPFIAKNLKAEYDSISCRNVANVYKNREKNK